MKLCSWSRAINQNCILGFGTWSSFPVLELNTGTKGSQPFVFLWNEGSPENYRRRLGEEKEDYDFQSTRSSYSGDNLSSAHALLNEDAPKEKYAAVNVSLLVYNERKRRGKSP